MDKPSGIMEKPLIDPLSWLSPSPKPQVEALQAVSWYVLVIWQLVI